MRRLIVAGLAGVLAATTLSFQAAEVMAAPGVSPWNRGCIRIYNQWKKKPKHKAFAVARNTQGEACGSTWNAPSKKAAEDGARKWCKKYMEGGGSCRITASE